MALQLYNTRTRAVEPFTPLHDGEVRVYVCGLTPSAQAHLGHARSFIFFDVLRRYLTHLGYRVTYVQNVTDIDDRSIARAKETGENWRDIVGGYYASFKASMRTLGVREPDEEPYATQYIAPIVAMIEQLVAAEYAYVSRDGVYYRVARFPRYGELSRRNIEELQAGARIEVDEYKDDPLDFALWKFAKPGEPQWESPWGAGRPGWHIECSAMSRQLLDTAGVGFDIHGGGADLIFPHHENEIAQSEPLMTHPPMANFWVHGGLLLYNGRKMSKSLGNFEPLEDVVKRYDPQAIRLAFLQTGYRKVMNFTEESMAAATSTLERVKKRYRELQNGLRPGSAALRQAQDDKGAAQDDNSGAGRHDGLMTRIEAALDDDMNTAVALAEILSYDGTDAAEFADAMTLLGIEPNDSWLEERSNALPEDFIVRLQSALNGKAQRSFAQLSAEEAIAAVIEARAGARAEKNWAMSDFYRDALASCGVALKDSKDGTTWEVV